jgi:hypothetical protein
MRLAKPTARALLAFVLAGAAAGCNSLLDVDNPATTADDDLNTEDVAQSLVNGVVARFGTMYDSLALYSAYFTDEAVTGHNFETVQQVDLRRVTDRNSEIYRVLQFTRAAADSVEARLVRLLPDSAARALGVARVQAYGSITYTLMGEFLCAAPVDPVSDAITSDSMFRIAIERAGRAIATATAFKAAGGAAARADSLIHLARVSAARAHLNLGERAQAAAGSAQVPAGFEFRVHYDLANRNNSFFGAVAGTNRNLGVDAAFRGLDDPRVRYNPAGGTGHDQRTVLYAPYLAPSFGGYSASTPNQAFARETSIRFVSGLEARYILAEAQGVSGAGNVDFINTRRAAGGQAALQNPTEAEFLSALIDQRRRDFFLDGHRVGDLRRYIRLYQQDFFPAGAHPTAGRGNYEGDVCFIPLEGEAVGNPGYNP